MYTAIKRLGAIALLASLTACGAIPEARGPILPLRKLRLYETGVAYFERSGRVVDSATLPVPAGHLDDALKSLVVHSEGGGGAISGVVFGSSVGSGMARVMAGLPTDGTQTISHAHLLTALRGANVEIATKREELVVGRIVEVAELPAPEPKGDAKPDAPDVSILIMSQRGEIRRFRTSELVSVRPTDPTHTSRLETALDAMSQRGAQTRRFLTVHAASTKPITLGYVAEAPVWRTNYRVVLDRASDKATLQGWALVHNDTDEDWRGVKVELVNGQPDSFLFPLAAPRYARRKLVEPSAELATSPQLLDKTVDALWGDTVTERFVGGGSGSGHGYGLGSFGSLGHGAGRSSRPSLMRHASVGVSDAERSGESSELRVGNLASMAPAVGVDSRTLFIYTFPSRVDLGARSSALLPLAQQTVEASPITWFEDLSGSGRSGIKFQNTTSQTLPEGPLSVFAEGGFVGETILDRLRPSERRFLLLGNDLDVEVSATIVHVASEPSRVRYDGHALAEHYVSTTTRKVLVENKSAEKRAVYATMRLANNASIAGADAVDYDVESKRPVVVVHAPPRAKVEKRVVTTEGLSRTMPVTSLRSEKLLELSKASALPPQARARMAAAATLLADRESLQGQQLQSQTTIEELEAEMARSRDNLKAMGGDKGGAGGAQNPFVKRLLEAEDRLAKLRSQRAERDKRIESKLEDVRRELRQLGS